MQFDTPCVTRTQSPAASEHRTVVRTSIRHRTCDASGQLTLFGGGTCVTECKFLPGQIAQSPPPPYKRDWGLRFGAATADCRTCPTKAHKRGGRCESPQVAHVGIRHLCCRTGRPTTRGTPSRNAPSYTCETMRWFGNQQRPE